jgi:predicted glycogen debranching enzyme
MIPNHFADLGGEPQFNSVDASLWFIAAVDALRLAAARTAPDLLSASEDAQLQDAIHAILRGYRRGTRFGIRADGDGLLAAGEPGAALTWMDAVVDGHPVTSRIGKPVEVQALWINALRIAGRQNAEWRALAAQAIESFRRRFWNAPAGALYDVVDVDHVVGTSDGSIRPNQIFAVGGLPFALLEGDQARRVVDTVEQQLWTPAGLRTLAPGSPGYAGRYEGDGPTRDAAYHQGTAWPWLIGAFVDAWLRVRDRDAATIREARTRFLDPLLARLDENGLGHLSEVADGDAPHLGRGAPFQAWSLGEALWLDRVVLHPL